MEASSSKKAKAFRPPGNTSVHCLVDGCIADLSMCRDYHRRHKVCEIHSKTPMVTIGGREQRFCQQCSRFHSLGEFDEGKRSCRKRLDGHNRRRRKPPPDFLGRNPGLIFSTHQTSAGTRLLSFANPPLLSTSAPGPTWPTAVKLEPEIPLYPGHTFHDCSPRNVSQLQFVHATDDEPNNNNNTNNVDDDDDAVLGCSSSSRALSLLSSTPPLEFHLSQVVLPPTQPLLHDIRHTGVFMQPPVIGDPDTSSALTTVHFPEMFQAPGGERPQSTLTGGPYQTHSFMWE